MSKRAEKSPKMKAHSYTNQQLEAGVLLATGFDKRMPGMIHVDLAIPLIGDDTLRFSLDQFIAFCEACQKVCDVSCEIGAVMQGIQLALDDDDDPSLLSRAMARLEEYMAEMQKEDGATPEQLARFFVGSKLN